MSFPFLPPNLELTTAPTAILLPADSAEPRADSTEGGEPREDTTQGGEPRADSTEGVEENPSSPKKARVEVGGEKTVDGLEENQPGQEIKVAEQ